MTPSISTQKPVHDLPTPEPESPLRSRKPYRFSTLCATVENPDLKDNFGSSSVPIYQTATFKGVDGDFDYTRSGNPTRSHLEHHLAKMYSASHAFALSSGMAALDIITRLIKPHSTIVTGDDLYGGTNRLLNYLRNNNGVIVHHVDTTNPSSVLPYLTPDVSMVLLESPTNPLLKVIDLPKIIAEAKERAPNAILVVDNTMMGPYLQRPLEFGADIIYDSATKYLSGHHDLMAGVIVCNRDDLAKQMAHMVNSVGNGLSPFDSFLLLRGVKTLVIRMDRQQASARVVAEWLFRLGFHVNYPGLESHPNREVHERISDGPGAVLSFTTGDKSLSEKIVAGTRLWGITVSFGCINSLISMPCLMSHASIDPATRAARGFPEDVIRLCVGIEDPEDLIEDLRHAMFEAGAIELSASTEQRYVRAKPKVEDPISRAVEKLGKELSSIGTNRPKENREWLVSAPGKVILFGEHAVVHGVTALAVSVDLRCYALTTPRHDGKVSVHLIDVEDFKFEWKLEDLPWDLTNGIAPGELHGDTLDQKVIDGILKRSIPDTASSKAKNASLAFLYLYMMLTHGGERPSFNLSARATLPIGAGLGSSASFSVCIATALLLLHQRISIPPLPEPSRSPGARSSTDPGHIHVPHQGRKAIPGDVAEEVNRWAFVSEKVLHGTPSGVDNSVSVFGGALAYTKTGFAGKKGGMEPIQGFKSLKFLLTDSKVPRDTKALVAGVAAKKAKDPKKIDAILDAIQSISDEARRALADPELERADLLTALSALVNENHAHLVDLGVSHPSLEAIRAKTASEPHKLSTKLTGAGGGGCAVTLLPDNLEQSNLEKLVSALEGDGYGTYLTSVGGSGLGILSPYNRDPESHLDDGPVTPPETPALGGSPGTETGLYKSHRAVFESKSPAELVEWMESRGRWLYV